jgi:hypothetical protein
MHQGKRGDGVRQTHVLGHDPVDNPNQADSNALV